MKKIITISVICLVGVLMSSTVALGYFQCSFLGCGAAHMTDHYYGQHQWIDGETYSYGVCKTDANYKGSLMLNLLAARIESEHRYVDMDWDTYGDQATGQNTDYVKFDTRLNYPQVVEARWIRWISHGYCFHCNDQYHYAVQFP